MSGRAADNVVIKNIYYMLAYASGVSGNDSRSLFTHDMAQVESESFENYLDLLCRILIQAIHYQRLRGFERDYINEEDDLALVRGKIDIAQTLHMRSKGSIQLHCNYDELLEDTYKNRIIKTTSEYLLMLGDVGHHTKKELREALIYLQSVGVVSASSIDWRKIRYHKFNQYYRFLMSVCYMILEGKIMTEKFGGDIRFPDLLSEQRLSSLFQSFVLEYFRRHHGYLRPASPKANYGIEMPLSLLPSLDTDIVLHGDNSILVIDTKCYGQILQTHCDKEILSPAHRNQIFSYVEHYKFKSPQKQTSGMLLYAQTELEDPLSEQWSELGHNYFLKTLNLGSDFGNIASTLDAIANSVD